MWFLSRSARTSPPQDNRPVCRQCVSFRATYILKSPPQDDISWYSDQKKNEVLICRSWRPWEKVQSSDSGLVPYTAQLAHGFLRIVRHVMFSDHMAKTAYSLRKQFSCLLSRKTNIVQVLECTHRQISLTCERHTIRHGIVSLMQPRTDHSMLNWLS